MCQSVSQSVNFGTPSISRERLKLETSNLEDRLTTRGTSEKKSKIKSTGVVKGSRCILLEFLDPLHILGMVQAKNVKFCTQT